MNVSKYVISIDKLAVLTPLSKSEVAGQYVLINSKS